MPRTTATTIPAFLLDLVGSHVVGPDALAKTALRYEYAGAEELLSHLASSGRRSSEEIVTASRTGAADIVADLTAPGLYALAYLVLGRPSHPSRVEMAADLFSLARQVADRDGSAVEHAQLDLQTQLATGRHEDIRRLEGTVGMDPWVLWAGEADMINPFSGRAPAGLGAWHATFNAPFIQRGIAPMTFTDDESPFDSVTTSAPAGSVDGPLVSIVMPVFAPSDSLVTAVRSLLEQTWRNVQVIVVDDASPEGYEAIFERVRSLDDRVEYVRMPTNGGAYRARNRGVVLARGEFVGIQDGDDWSHPERIERQMNLFEQDPALVATLSKAIRLHNDLRITKVGSLPFNKNAPSLIFRRERVLERVGAFDEMRKAADTEFIERLSAAFGPGTVRTLEEPLSLYQLTDGSLSREDFRLSWHREARVSYHGSFRHWHRQIAAGAGAVVESATGRAFPAPPELMGTPYPTGPDVVLMADWRSGPLAHAGLAAQIEAAASTGLDVGLARGDAVRFSTARRSYAPPPIQQLLADRRARWTPVGAPVDPRLLIVRDTDLLTLPRDAAAVAIRPRRVVVVADRLPHDGETSRTAYDPVHIESTALSLFGVHAEWWPATSTIHAALGESGARGLRHPPAPTEVVTTTRAALRRIVGVPVIGVADSSPFAAERVDRARLTAIVPRGPGYDVRVLESSRAAAAEHARRGWLTYDPAVITPSEFFDQCDFYVGLAARTPSTGLLRQVLEAMSRGCVPVVDQAYRPWLGDSALYLDDGSITQHVGVAVHDPALFAAQQLRARQFCQNELSAERFASTITTLLAGGPR